MNTILKTKEEKYVPRYFSEEGELILTDCIPRELEKYEKMSVMEGIRRGLVRSVHFMTP